MDYILKIDMVPVLSYGCMAPSFFERSEFFGLKGDGRKL
jgi:hypothetical protein